MKKKSPTTIKPPKFKAVPKKGKPSTDKRVMVAGKKSMLGKKC